MTPSLFAGIRERIASSNAPPPPRRIPINQPRPAGQAPVPIDDIRRSLESFRAGSRTGSGATATPPLFSGVGSGATPSFQDLLRKSGSPAPRPQGGPSAGDAKHDSFDFSVLRNYVRKNDPQRQPPAASYMTPLSDKIFGKEQRERAGTPQPGSEKEEADDAANMLLKEYDTEELGEKLAGLRPPGAGKDGKEWVSFQELQGRIAELNKLERPKLGLFGALRNSLENISQADKKKAIRISSLSVFNITGNAVPEYLHHPPQEELLERYFHPDHMSGEEKMKLELQKVRDEFKMSENDCGSARVQIAQLTLKIKHLSSVLHKKDKHSRKGLQDMVQRRKKYLKYLRRTDWDSYCMVLSKLGLRDIPEYKVPDYKKTQPTKAQSKKSKSKRKRKMKA